MKMQHTVYLEMKHKVILDKLIALRGIGNGKQGTPNYNKAILQAIEAIDTAREAHFQSLLEHYRLHKYIGRLETTDRFHKEVDKLIKTKPKLYKRIIEGKVSRWDD